MTHFGSVALRTRWAIALGIALTACGPVIVEPTMRETLRDCNDMDPEDVYVVEGPSGHYPELEEWIIRNADRLSVWCVQFDDLTAAMIDPTSGELIYGTSEPDATHLYRYTWNRYSDDPREIDPPEYPNDLNDFLMTVHCARRLFVSPLDGSLFYRCTKETFAETGEPILPQLDIPLAIGTDGRFLVGRLPNGHHRWGYHPPAVSLGEVDRDGTFRQLAVPTEFSDRLVLAARSHGDGFRVAISDEHTGAAWLLDVTADGDVRLEGQLAPDAPWDYPDDWERGAALDGAGAIYYTRGDSLVRRGLGEAAAVEFDTCDPEWCEYAKVFSGP